MSARKKKRKAKKAKLTSEQLRKKLKLKHFEVKNRLSEKHPKVDKFFKEKKLDPGKIRQHSAKIIGAGAIAGSILLTPVADSKSLPTPTELIEKINLKTKAGTSSELHGLLVGSLKSILPNDPRPLTRNEEKIIEQLFGDVVGVKVKASLEGEHLNTTYGYIGAEQHLRRYSGDTLLQHGSGDTISEGLAPGLGAWGYLAQTREEMTPELEEVERWYAVVQTLYLPDWNTRQPYLKDWYKYRKVLIVDTESGNAVVAAIADSGPAAWTGKHFGGSPEVMDYLGGAKYKKGAVVIFFVDDSENKVPLGPVYYN